MPQTGIVRYGWNERVGVKRMHAAADIHEILHDVVGRRVAARALTEEALHAHAVPVHTDEVEVCGHGRLERVMAQ